MKRGDKLFGLVVSVCDASNAHFANVVVVHDNQLGINNLFYVSREAFKLPENHVFYTDGNEFDLVADLKNQIRKKEKPLNMGDWISWFYSDTEDIADFEREIRINEVRAGNPYIQLLLECVKSPSDDLLHTSSFGYVSLSEEEGIRFLPNVAFHAWLNVYIDGPFKNETFCVTFGQFESSTQDIQLRVLDAPWTEHYKVVMRGLSLSDDEDWLIEKKEEKNHRENNVKGLHGYYISYRNIYVDSRPDKLFTVPYVNEELLAPGVKYRFDAFWNDERFVLSGHPEKLIDQDVLHTKWADDTSRRILVLENVKQRQDLKMLFHTDKLAFGTMDDPTGALKLHHLSRYSESQCRVYFYEDEHATFGRFRIESVDVDKAKKIDKNVRERTEVHELQGVHGVVVSADGRVFAASQSPLRFELPDGRSDLQVGTQIVFSAQLHLETKIFHIQDASIKVLQSPIEHFEFNGRNVFKTTALFLPLGDSVRGLVSKQFSLLDDPLRTLSRAAFQNKKMTERTVWVAEAGLDATGKRRVAQAPFFIVSTKSSRPIFTGTKFVDEHGRDVGGWIKNRDGTLTEMIESQEVRTITKSKFSLPSGTDLLSLTSSSSFDCGCSEKKCKSRILLLRLIKDVNFQTLLFSDSVPESISARVLGCVL